MRVCILTTSFPAYKGHFQSPFIYELAKNLARKGLDVDVICPFYDMSNDKEENWEGVKIHRFKFWFTRKGQKLVQGGGIPSMLKSSFIAKIQLPLFLLFFYLRSRKYAKQSDIIHAQWAFSGIVGAKLKKKYHKPLILTERGAAANMAVANSIMKKVLMNVLNSCDFVAANNDNQIDMFRKLGIPEAKLMAIPNGFDTEKFKPRDSKAARKKLRLPQDRKIILFVGWLIGRKGCDHLIKAMKKVAQKYPKSLLVIVGEGNMESKLKGMVKDLSLETNITFAGAKAPDEIPSYMNAADIFVLPSLSEGRPNVVGEAMASGLPVIATKVSGTPEFIDDKKDGILIKAGDSDAIAEPLAALLSDSSKRKRLGAAARKSLMQKGLSWDACVSKYISIYKKIKNP